jgi:hypothetical protein
MTEMVREILGSKDRRHRLQMLGRQPTAQAALASRIQSAHDSGRSWQHSGKRGTDRKMGQQGPPTCVRVA